jgi:hypothetical protein
MATILVNVSDELQSILQKFDLDPQNFVEKAVFEHLRKILLICPLTDKICLHDGSCNECLVVKKLEE